MYTQVLREYRKIRLPYYYSHLHVYAYLNIDLPESFQPVIQFGQRRFPERGWRTSRRVFSGLRLGHHGARHHQILLVQHLKKINKLVK